MKRLRHILPAIWVALGATLPAASRADAFPVPAELWDRPRTGPLVIATPAIRSALDALLASPEARLTIRHPPGADPSAQAEELRAWLVAHALEPARVFLRADLAPRQPIVLEVGVPR